jgi:hypothetical protein
MRNIYQFGRKRYPIQLTRNDGVTLVLSMTADSGRIIYRDKIDTIIGIKHPGIYLGTDQFGVDWIAHHHYENGKPAIETLDAFAKGNQCFWDEREVFYNRHEIVYRAVEYWRNGKYYHWLRQNCQHFVNEVVQNKHYSEGVDKGADIAMGTGGFMLLAGLILGNKTLVQAGLVTTTVGGIAKIGNRV